MGITRYSFALRNRNKSHQKKIYHWVKKSSTKKENVRIDFTILQDELETQLYAIQERLMITRQYIRSIRYEYEGSSREAVDHYFDVITNIYERVCNYCTRNYKENFPVFKCFLDEIEEEYMALVTEGGFSEAEVYDYVYGDDSHSAPPYESDRGSYVTSESESENDIPVELLSSMRL